MPGPMHHSPHRIIWKALVDLGLIIDPDTLDYENQDDIPNGTWPGYYSREPDRPDDLVKVAGTAGRNFGTTMVDSELQTHHGIQIMVRGFDDDLAERKAREIALTLHALPRTYVIVDDDGTGTGSIAYTYLIASFTCTTDVIPLGRDTPEAKRSRFTINGTVPIRQCQ